MECWEQYNCRIFWKKLKIKVSIFAKSARIIRSNPHVYKILPFMQSFYLLETSYIFFALEAFLFKKK